MAKAKSKTGSKRGGAKGDKARSAERPARRRKPGELARIVVALALLGSALVVVLVLFLLAIAGGSGSEAVATESRTRGQADGGAPRGPKPGGFISSTLTDPSGRPLLGSQSEQKRNQILVVDLFHEIIGRYPNLREQRLWFDVGSPANQSIQQMRRKGASDAEIANYIAGILMESSEHKGKMPLIKWPAAQLKRPSMDLSDGAAVVGAMVARTVGYRDDIPRANDVQLVEQLAKDFGLDRPSDRTLYPMTRMLQTISASSDVNEHFLDDDTSLDVELEAMRVALRRGKLLVLFGSDAPGVYRFIAVSAFDGRGEFVVRDPLGRLPEKLSPVALAAFLVKPGRQKRSTQAYWLDLPGDRRSPRCPPPGTGPSIVTAPPTAPPPEIAKLNEGSEFSGVIPGAQVNLSRLRTPPGEHTTRGTISITADQIDEVLTKAGSPAAGSGVSWVKWGRFYNIDPVYALAFFRRESVFGTHKRWIGRMPNGDTTKNVGNIRFRGAPNPQREPQYGGFNGFRSYASWDAGIHDWYKLIAQDANYAGLHTVEQILPKYAPTFENDTDDYIRDVVTWAREWKDRFGTAARAVAARAIDTSISEAQVQKARLLSDCP